jgi:hypothetical protein
MDKNRMGVVKDRPHLLSPPPPLGGSACSNGTVKSEDECCGVLVAFLYVSA